MSDSNNRNVVTMGAEIVRVRHTLAVDNIYNRDVTTMAEIVLRDLRVSRLSYYVLH